MKQLILSAFWVNIAPLLVFITLVPVFGKIVGDKQFQKSKIPFWLSLFSAIANAVSFTVVTLAIKNDMATDALIYQGIFFAGFICSLICTVYYMRHHIVFSAYVSDSHPHQKPKVSISDLTRQELKVVNEEFNEDNDSTLQVKKPVELGLEV